MNGKRVAYTTRVKLFLGLVSYSKHNGGPKVITPPIRQLFLNCYLLIIKPTLTSSSLKVGNIYIE